MKHRLLYTADRVRSVFAKMRGELREEHERHLFEMAELRRELDQIRGDFEALCSAVRERQRAEVDLALLQRARDCRMRNAEGENFWLH